MCMSIHTTVLPAQEGGWWHHPATEGTWPQKAECHKSSHQAARRVCVGVSAVRRAACSPLRACRGTPAPARTYTHVFLLSLLFPFAWCLLWCEMLSSNKGVGTAHNMWQICRLKVISWVLLSGREIHRESMPTLHSDYFQQRWKRHLERSLV